MHVRTISKQFKHFRLKWPGDVELISGESGVDMNWIRCIYKYLSLSNTRTQRPDICPTRCFASKPKVSEIAGDGAGIIIFFVLSTSRASDCPTFSERRSHLRYAGTRRCRGGAGCASLLPVISVLNSITSFFCSYFRHEKITLVSFLMH